MDMVCSMSQAEFIAQEELEMSFLFSHRNLAGEQLKDKGFGTRQSGVLAGSQDSPIALGKLHGLSRHQETGNDNKNTHPQGCVGDSQVALVVKNLPANVGDIRDTGSVPEMGTAPGEAHGNSPQHSFLGNPMDRGAWRATDYRGAKSQT